VAELDSMIAVTYVAGDLCDKATGDTYTTRINLICDLAEDNGWPTYVSTDGCNFTFQWKSRYACRVCLESDINKVESTCSDGKRVVREFTEKNCILTGKHRFGFLEDCSEVGELI
jgi:Tfp pilus assembly protein PilX